MSGFPWESGRVESGKWEVGSGRANQKNETSTRTAEPNAPEIVCVRAWNDRQTEFPLSVRPSVRARQQ